MVSERLQQVVAEHGPWTAMAIKLPDWSAPLGAADALAGLIAQLSRNRGEIAQYARQALRFAREHSFERTFARRVEHLRSLSR